MGNLTQDSLKTIQGMVKEHIFTDKSQKRQENGSITVFLEIIDFYFLSYH